MELLPYLMAALAQKRAAHNKALRLLDGLVQLSVKSRSQTAAPASPTDRDRYILASGVSGGWPGWGRLASESGLPDRWRLAAPAAS